EIDRINLDLRHASSGELALSNDMIHVPSGIAVASINPRSVHIAFERRVDKVVEGSSQGAGGPQHGCVVAEIQAAPSTVQLPGGEGTLAALSAIRTREISLEGRTELFTVETEVILPEGVDIVGNARISVQIRIDEELVTRKIPGVSVVLKGEGDPSRWQVTP